MATTVKVLARTAASLTSATLYTTPSDKSTVVTDILVANTAATAATFTLSLNGLPIAQDVSIPANDSISLSIKQVIEATQTITGLASAITVIFHVSGVEVA